MTTVAAAALSLAAGPQGHVATLTRSAIPLSQTASVVDSGSDQVRPETSRIRHVVIIFQENHSFDDLLGRLCQQRRPTCDGYTGRVQFADGRVAPNIRESDIVPEVSHSRRSQGLGLHDEWDHIGGCVKGRHHCVTHVVPSQIPNLARLATKFAVADRTFEALPSSSWGSHLRLASGAPLGFWNGDVPRSSVTGAPRRSGWGCPSQRDEWWRGHEWVPACVPDRQGRGPYRTSPVLYHPTVMQRLEGRHLPWHIYQGSSELQGAWHGPWQFCTYFYWCYRNRMDAQHVSSDRDFTAAARGDEPMASVSFLIPPGPFSQHNTTSLKRGDNYIGRLVHAVMNGPRWRSTAIFITYDDCGCFYDHVTPPPGEGFREPMVIVSPWVKRGYTDARATSMPYGMQAFIEHNFGLAPLSRQVSGAYDYHQAFDFHQKPLTGIRTTTQPISKREQARLRALIPTWRHELS